jgi:hypothetical protein
MACNVCSLINPLPFHRRQVVATASDDAPVARRPLHNQWFSPTLQSVWRHPDAARTLGPLLATFDNLVAMTGTDQCLPDLNSLNLRNVVTGCLPQEEMSFPGALQAFEGRMGIVMESYI